MLTKKKSILLLIYSCISLNVFGQNLGSWQVYSSYSTANSISVSSDGTVYSSTLGGIFATSENGSSTTFSTIEGMHRLDPTHSVYIEQTDELVLGYSDGIIDLFDISNSSFRKIEDIFRVEQFPSKKINDIILNESKLYIATDFGIVVFRIDGFFVENTFLRIGNFNRGIQINDIDISGDSIYVATEQGVAIANLNQNLFDESSWANYNENNNLGSEIVTKVVAFNNDVYAVSNDQLYSKNGNEWVTTNRFGAGTVINFEKSVIDLGVLFSSKAVIESTTGSQTQITFPGTTSLISFYLGEDTHLFGTLDEGIYQVNKSNPDNREQILLEGPYLNFFSQLNYENNTLISTSTAIFPQADPFNSVRGYYLFSDGIWSSYNTKTNDVLSSARIGTIYSTSSTSKNHYFGGWGKGVVKHNIETNDIAFYNSSNSGFRGINSGGSFVVIPGLYNDSKENMWATSFDSDKPLNVFLEDNEEWLHFNKQPISSDNLYFYIFIDSNDQKWISLVDFSNNGKGLLVLDTKDINDPNDDAFKKLTSGTNNGNLPDEEVTAIIEDKNGEVWIGTARGIARFIFPNFIIGSNNPNDFQAQWLVNEDTSASSRFLLRDVSVSTLAVNEANQKWIGSVNQGIWVLNEEGSRIEKRFTKENSPLISNNILSITINDETGEVFIATDLGLVSYKDLAITPVNKMDELKVYPNPFSYSRNNQIVIEDLSEVTNIKILGVDGTVVQELETRGGRVSWNGLDYQGNRLGTGVYFVVALERDGSEKGIGKVIIIN